MKLKLKDEATAFEQAKPFFLVVLFVLALSLLFYTRWLVLAAILGIGLGVLIAPVPDYLKRWRVPRVISVLGLLVLVFGAFYMVFYLMSGLFAEQFSLLVDRWPEITKNLEEVWKKFLASNPWIREQFEDFNFSETVRSTASNVFNYLQTGLTTVFGAIFVIVIGLYTAVGIDRYFDGAVHAFPIYQRKEVRRLGKRCASLIRKWFGATLLNAFVLGIVTALALWLIGIQFWAVFGVLIAVLNLIPFVGTFIVFALLFLVTLATDPGMLVWVIVVFFVIQQIESDITLPYIMRGQVKIPEMPLLIFMLVLGQWFGVIGYFMAPPILAILGLLYSEVYIPYIEGRPAKN